MKKSFGYTYILLITLTIITALFSNSTSKISQITVIIIMGLSAIKFLLVAFQFMELKKANSFWKVSLTVALSLIVFMIIIMQ